MTSPDIQATLAYIDSYWDTVILKPTKKRLGRHILERVTMKTEDKDHHIISVPYAAVVPNNAKYRYVFYWDTYFIFQGLLGTKREWVVPEMVQNFLYLFKKYHIIPNLSHPEALGRSQAPFLTSMILDAYEVLSRDRRVSTRMKRLLHGKKNWLKKAISLAKAEYDDVWQSEILFDYQHYNHRVAEYNLNVYGGRDTSYPQVAEQESGWDMTSRFYNRCNEFLAVDLNSLIYKYERDFAHAADILGNKADKDHWLEVAKARQKRMNKYFWNEEKGFFFDFDYINKVQSSFYSLAGFVPLWAGLATPEQAKKCVKHLKRFETPFGLSITDKASLPQDIDMSSFPEPLRITMQQLLKPKQWDYPNIWPPLEYLTVIGLLKYGFKKEAKKIMEKYITTNTQVFLKYHALAEKLDGLTGDLPGTYWYPTQLGFGWTNAIYYRYTQLLASI